MRYSYTSGFENYKKAQRTFIRSSVRVRTLFHLKMWGYTVIGILLLASCAPIAFERGSHLFALLGYILGCGLLGGGVIGSALWPWQRKRSYRLWNGDEELLHLYAEVEGPLLVLGRPDRSESRLQRAAICKVLEDDDLLLLFLGKKKFIYIPKSIGLPAIKDIREWLDLPGAPSSC